MLRRVLQILAAIALVFVCYYVIVWVFGLLGVIVPDKLLMAIMVFIGLVAVIGALGGKFDTWWS